MARIVMMMRWNGKIVVEKDLFRRSRSNKGDCDSRPQQRKSRQPKFCGCLRSGKVWLEVIEKEAWLRKWWVGLRRWIAEELDNQLLLITGGKPVFRKGISRSVRIGRRKIYHLLPQIVYVLRILSISLLKMAWLSLVVCGGWAVCFGSKIRTCWESIIRAKNVCPFLEG